MATILAPLQPALDDTWPVALAVTVTEIEATVDAFFAPVPVDDPYGTGSQLTLDLFDYEAELADYREWIEEQDDRRALMGGMW